MTNTHRHSASIHWINYVKPILSLFLFFLVAPLIYGIAELWRLWTTSYTISRDSVRKKRGLFSVEADELRTESIEYIEIDQPFMGRMFGYGDITFVGKGGSRIVFYAISSPSRLRDVFNNISRE